ncbi:MAG: CUAEP/CCAEP-tail radical SAM protein [Acidobacteriota bacterium]|nr:CUAEP/CCAEP-tail radical SAM protein [Acidobacteriota bacterium]
MKILLISTYELGRQPFGLASPAAWLEGHEVICADLSIEKLSPDTVRGARLVAFYLPMHTATRLAGPVLRKVKELNPAAHVCCFGLYAPLNAEWLRKQGAETILGGEFEGGLLSLVHRLEGGSGGPQTEPLVSLERLDFRAPDRSGMPGLERYARLRINGSSKVAGYTEASRGCKHRCRHCPVVPVYDGRFRVVRHEVVLEDIRRQVRVGAEHISFGDPDFWNGPTHAQRIVEALHRKFPRLTYDATIKIEHLRNHRELLPVLKETGCLFVTSAVESVDDEVLRKLDKGHTRADFIATVEDFREAGLTIAPTFIPFTPWTTRESYRDLLKVLLDMDLVENVSPIQLALRLLIPAGSLMLELGDVQSVVTGYDDEALLHRWAHADPEVDRMAAAAMRIAAETAPRRELFRRFRSLVEDVPLRENFDLIPRSAIPYMDEPWYC